MTELAGAPGRAMPSDFAVGMATSLMSRFDFEGSKFLSRRAAGHFSMSIRLYLPPVLALQQPLQS
eukprot:CAMPEP_0202906360 /NCGR_PEP_ID=MMETSP1392-20130828/38537_1 /ASSEMBLY_ACC=CAM_ASM_000868 /TAXON_ID=225041 /ORGANISM="Chlamydomonas chlamydogama, Strain SAG 11-48b" /LENGTH=64 /DNA_ID=CAMNT_0049594833 /DNA_START=89 /DNA_END=280 /DNA_ORIENTATION=-